MKFLQIVTLFIIPRVLNETRLSIETRESLVSTNLENPNFKTFEMLQFAEFEAFALKIVICSSKTLNYTSINYS